MKCDVPLFSGGAISLLTDDGNMIVVMNPGSGANLEFLYPKSNIIDPDGFEFEETLNLRQLLI